MSDEATLAICPCGRVPKSLHISDAGQGGKYALVYPGCCGEWTIEFRTAHHNLLSKETMDLAIAAWNAAPRKESK